MKSGKSFSLSGFSYPHDKRLLRDGQSGRKGVNQETPTPKKCRSPGEPYIYVAPSVARLLYPAPNKLSSLQGCVIISSMCFSWRWSNKFTPVFVFSVGSVLETWRSVTAIESLPSTKNLSPLCPSTGRGKGRSRVQGVGVGSSSVLSCFIDLYFIVIDKALPCYCASLGVT